MYILELTQDLSKFIYDRSIEYCNNETTQVINEAIEKKQVLDIYAKKWENLMKEVINNITNIKIHLRIIYIFNFLTSLFSHVICTNQNIYLIQVEERCCSH